MPTLEIHGASFSNLVWAVRLAAAEKGVAVEHHECMPRADAAAAIHPVGKIPVARCGDLEIFESRAVAGYIDEAFDGPSLFGATPEAKARVDQWASYALTLIDPLIIRQTVLERLAPMFFKRPCDEEKVAGALAALPAALDGLERGITEEGFLGGATYTYADALMTPMLYYLAQQPEGATLIEERPWLKAYAERMQARESFTATRPAGM